MFNEAMAERQRRESSELKERLARWVAAPSAPSDLRQAFLEALEQRQARWLPLIELAANDRGWRAELLRHPSAFWMLALSRPECLERMIDMGFEWPAQCERLRSEAWASFRHAESEPADEGECLVECLSRLVDQGLSASLAERVSWAAEASAPLKLPQLDIARARSELLAKAVASSERWELLEQNGPSKGLDPNADSGGKGRL